VTASDSTEITKRLQRIKKLCDELSEAQDDNRKYRRLIKRIRDEADAFSETIGTHDHKSHET
jgi:hypothetical protein